MMIINTYFTAFYYTSIIIYSLSICLHVAYYLSIYLSIYYLYLYLPILSIPLSTYTIFVYTYIYMYIFTPSVYMFPIIYLSILSWLTLPVQWHRFPSQILTRRHWTATTRAFRTRQVCNFFLSLVVYMICRLQRVHLCLTLSSMFKSHRVFLSLPVSSSDLDLFLNASICLLLTLLRSRCFGSEC
jgi:hypothetical protein